MRFNKIFKLLLEKLTAKGLLGASLPDYGYYYKYVNDLSTNFHDNILPYEVRTEAINFWRYRIDNKTLYFWFDYEPEMLQDLITYLGKRGYPVVKTLQMQHGSPNFYIAHGGKEDYIKNNE